MDATTDMGDEDLAEPAVPARIGPYLVLERLGAGGMGVVYAAYDPRLDRKIAVKLLNERTTGRFLEARPRLLREARALARLTHPNVVGVYDVGTIPHDDADRVYVAMELVDGVTMGRWQRATQRSIGEIIDKYVEAGRGLAAAHAQGLVHRDFKPDNVLVDALGRVRVLDFGLAIGGHDPLPDVQETIETYDSSPSARITATGVILGTPAYMALEQLRAEPTDARADQFAFCVALFEALYGHRPYAGRSVRELTENVARGEVVLPPDLRRVPRWLRRALWRGLRPDPEARWPSMDALLRALTRGRQRRLDRVAMLGTVMLGLGGAIATSLHGSAPDRCGSASARADEVWGPVERGHVRDAILDTRAPYAADTWVRIEAGLDEYAKGWSAARRQTCEADESTAPSEQVDLKIRCLAGRLDAMGALIGVLARTDTSTVSNAAAAVAKLPHLDVCDDPLAIQGWLATEPNEAAADEVGELQRELAAAAALEWSGRYRDGVPIAQRVIDAAATAGHTVVEAEARRQLGKLQYKLAEYADAESQMSKAAWLAVSARRDRLAALTMIELVGLVGYMQARTEAGIEWSRHAAATQSRFSASALDRAQLVASLGAVHYRAGEYEAAHAEYAEACALLENPDDDETRQERSNMLNNLGNVAARSGDFDEAYTHLREAAELTEALRGSSHPDVATPLANLGNLQLDRGDTEDALALHERALEIRRRALGENHPMTASSWMNLGIAHTERGELEPGLEKLERGLAIKLEVFGANHPDVAMAFNNVGETLRKLGALEEAIEAHQKSLAIWSDTQGPHHPYVGYPLTNLGLDLLASGEPEAARASFERALHDVDLRSVDSALAGIAAFGLARTLETLGEPATVTRPLVLTAREDLAGGTQRYEAERREIAAWLAEH